jgi:hypothetical protein
VHRNLSQIEDQLGAVKLALLNADSHQAIAQSAGALQRSFQ